MINPYAVNVARDMVLCLKAKETTRKPQCSKLRLATVHIGRTTNDLRRMSFHERVERGLS